MDAFPGAGRPAAAAAARARRSHAAALERIVLRIGWTMSPSDAVPGSAATAVATALLARWRWLTALRIARLRAERERGPERGLGARVLRRARDGWA